MAHRAGETGFDSVRSSDRLPDHNDAPGLPRQGTRRCRCRPLRPRRRNAPGRARLPVAATPFLSPALPAEIADAVDGIGGGHLILGLGAGGTEAGYRGRAILGARVAAGGHTPRPSHRCRYSMIRGWARNSSATAISPAPTVARTVPVRPADARVHEDADRLRKELGQEHDARQPLQAVGDGRSSQVPGIEEGKDSPPPGVGVPGLEVRPPELGQPPRPPSPSAARSATRSRTVAWLPGRASVVRDDGIRAGRSMGSQARSTKASAQPSRRAQRPHDGPRTRRIGPPGPLSAPTSTGVRTHLH